MISLKNLRRVFVALLISGSTASANAQEHSDPEWWTFPPPGMMKVFHDMYNHNPTTVYTVPIDGISHGGWTSGGNSTTVVGYIYTTCDGQMIQVGRIYPSQSYDYFPAPDSNGGAC